MLTPDVVGVHVKGKLPAGVTSTDLVLHVTEMLRQSKVVGKFVEFFGEDLAKLTVPDRATISNMAPEYGATVGFFPVDAQTLAYLRRTSRPEAQVAAAEAYYKLQGCFGPVLPGDVDYSQVLKLDLSTITPNVAGPKRPQDRIPLAELMPAFESVLKKPTAEGGYGKTDAVARTANDVADGARRVVGCGDVVIAAITSCTNTSNP